MLSASSTRRFNLLQLCAIGLWCATIGCQPAAGPMSPPTGSSPTVTTGEPGPSPTNVKRLILMTNGNSPFWDACRVGMQAAEQELNLASVGLTTVLEVNDATAQGQIDKLRQYASQSDIAGVAITVTDSENVAIAEELKKLEAKGVHVVIMDSDFKGELKKQRKYFVGTNNEQCGAELGKAASALRPDGGEYATFFGLASAQNVKERCAGFAKGAGDKLQSKDAMEDGMDRSRARDNVRNAIQNHPKLNTLVGIWSYNAPAIVDIVTELGRRKDFTIVVTDAEPIAIKNMEDGQIDAMVVQNPYRIGFESVRLLKALINREDATLKEMYPNYGQPDGDLFDTGLKIVVPDSNTTIKKELFQPSTELLKLSEFKDWLKKYSLEGS